MASLLTTGRQIKGSAMAGLTAAARDEASQQIAEEQLERAKDAQQASLVGTGLGIGGAAAIMKGGAAAATVAPTTVGGLVGGAAGGAGAGGGVLTGAQAVGSAGATAGATAGTSAAGGAAASGGAMAALANPVTWAVIAGLYLLKKVF